MSFFYICDDAVPQGSRLGTADVAVVLASGEIDYAASPQLEACVLGHLKAGRRRLLVDLSGVMFIDSMAIGVLVGAAARLRETGGSLGVVCARENQRVLRIFDIVGVAASIPLHHSREDALSEMLAAQPAPARAQPAVPVTSSCTLPPARPSGLAATRTYARDASAEPGQGTPASEVDELA